MTEEVPLSEFISDEEADQSESSESETGHTAEEEAAGSEPAGEAGDRPVAPEDVNPIEPTCVYDPAGVVCDGCGESVQRRFHTEAGLRCPECVSWNRGG